MKEGKYIDHGLCNMVVVIMIMDRAMCFQLYAKLLTTFSKLACIDPRTQLLLHFCVAFPRSDQRIWPIGLQACLRIMRSRVQDPRW